jgi:hypothetical protein
VKKKQSAEDKRKSEERYGDLQLKVDDLEKCLKGLSNLEREVTALRKAFVSWGGDKDDEDDTLSTDLTTLWTSVILSNPKAMFEIGSRYKSCSSL